MLKRSKRKINRLKKHNNKNLIFEQSLENYGTELNPDIPITTKTIPKTYIK